MVHACNIGFNYFYGEGNNHDGSKNQDEQLVSPISMVMVITMMVIKTKMNNIGVSFLMQEATMKNQLK